MLFPDNFCMKKWKLKNLDLLYLKIYKSSVAKFWGMLCVMPCLAPVPKIAHSYVVNRFL
jgi:hypothetical protein